MSESVFVSGQQSDFEGGSMTIVDFWEWADAVVVLYLIRNDSAQGLPYLDAHVAGGKQVSADPARSFFANPRPGAT